MKIMVVYAHPVETSFVNGLHRIALDTLRQRGHAVDDCDLYADGFDPVLSRDERMAYHDISVNQQGITPYLERLRNAEGLLFVYPVWNFGLPAILKGFMDRVFVPGATFDIDSKGRLAPRLTHLQRYGAVCTYGASPLAAFLVGDPPRKYMTRGIRGYLGAGCPCSYLASYNMNRSTPERRNAFAQKVERSLAGW